MKLCKISKAFNQLSDNTAHKGYHNKLDNIATLGRKKLSRATDNFANFKVVLGVEQEFFFLLEQKKLHEKVKLF